MLLNQETIQQIKNDFDRVIISSQGIDEPKTDKLFETWLASKELFIRAFGKQLIYEYPEKVTFELNPAAKHDRVLHFVNSVYYRWGYAELASFIEAQEEGFFKNITISDYTTSTGKTITKGTKLVKAFKHFIDNERSLTDVQNEASRIIQEDKIEGTLCLSVHPLDYLSASETTYNWRSCHSLDGEYRAGNLSYMMDSSTVLCYLKSDKDASLPNFPVDLKWNSKKWRVLLFFSNDWKMIFAGKQYPFDAVGGMEIVLDKLLPTAGLIGKDSYHVWSEWNECIHPTINIDGKDYMELRKHYVPVNEELVPIKKIIKDVPGSKHFNDLLNSSTYVPKYTVRSYLPYYGIELENKSSVFNIGAFTYCLHCGEEEVLGASDTMRCEKCEMEYGDIDNEVFTSCAICGNRMYYDDAHWVDDEPVCDDCFSNHCTVCDYCGDIYYNDDIRFHEASSEYLCTYCYNERLEEESEEL